MTLETAVAGSGGVTALALRPRRHGHLPSLSRRAADEPQRRLLLGELVADLRVAGAAALARGA